LEKSNLINIKLDLSTVIEQRKTLHKKNKQKKTCDVFVCLHWKTGERQHSSG